MDGRWTIHVDALGNFGQERIPGDVPVPVVPCDDAAIDRAVVALSSRGVLSHREYVEIAFCAAAEAGRLCAAVPRLPNPTKPGDRG